MGFGTDAWRVLRAARGEPASSRPRVVLLCVGAGIALAGLDFLVGPLIQFPFFFLLPVAFGAWRAGRAVGYALAIALPLARPLLLYPIWQKGADAFETADYTPGILLANAAIKVFVFALFAEMAHRIAQARRDIRTLRGMLPICAGCKRIRDEAQAWVPVEEYIRSRTGADFSHGICPECLRRLYPEFAP